MKKPILIGICIIALAIASLITSAQAGDENLTSILQGGISESISPSLAGTLSAGISESIGVQASASPVTVFSNGFEDSSGPGMFGFNTSVWEVRYGSDGNEAGIETGHVHSGIYSAHMEEGDEGNVDITTVSGALKLANQTGCMLSFWMLELGVESNDYIYVDIYDGSWHYGELALTGNGEVWTMHTLNLSGYNANNNFRIRWRAECNRDNDDIFIDDINITCIPSNYTPAADLSLDILDAQNNSVNATVIITNSSGQQIGNNSGSDSMSIPPGEYDITITPENHMVTSIEIFNADITAETTYIIEMDIPPQGDFAQLYAINPRINFTNATVRAVAKGGILMKCIDWNFTQQQCFGEWVPLKRIIPGTEYSFILTPADPGLAEVNGTFFDGFETGTFATNNWTTAGTGTAWYVSTDDPYAGTYLAEADSTGTESILQTAISTRKYVNLTLSFYYDTDGLDGGEYIAADWYNGTGWTNILSVEDTTGWTLYNSTLPVSAENNPDFMIRFRCLSGNPNEECKVDNVRLDGTAETTPPYSVTNLSNQSSWRTWIYWNWTNPADPDFGSAIVYINGAWAANTSNNYYNATGLSPNTSYTITVHTQDIYWNVNDTDVNSTARTYPPDAQEPVSDSPADQTVDLGQETTIQWTITDNDASGTYYVERNGTLYAGPSTWYNNTPLITNPNTYFLGTWGYTIYYNDSSGNSGSPDDVIVNVADNSTPSCSELPGNGNKPVLVNIIIDGDMSDWDAVVANPINTYTDLPSGGGDLDGVSTADRDLTMFAYTWNDDTFYMHWRRVNSGTNQVSMIAYIDYDNDGYMNSTDKVLKFVWSGSNRQWNSDLYNYIPSGAGGDLMNGSGYDLPGSISVNKSLETGILGGTDPGIYLETRINWTDIFLSGPVPLTIQPASANGAGTNLPSQIEDNMNPVSTTYASLLFRYDNEKSAGNGTSVYYTHDLMNCGLTPELIELSNISTQGWNLTLFYPNGTQVADTDSDGTPDIQLGSYNFTTLIARIDIPGSASFGTTDQTNITATSTTDNSHSRTVTDTTSIGDISILPSQRSLCAVPGEYSYYKFTVSNYQGFSDTIEVSATSSLGWSATLRYANGTLLSDTDSDGHTDTGSILPGGSRTIIVNASIPGGASIGQNDTTTVRINSSANPSLTSFSLAKTTVSYPVVIYPDYVRAIGQGTSTFYELTVKNCQQQADTIDISYTYVLNWTTSFYDSDMTTPLADTDSDTIIDTGKIGALGGDKTIYAKITAPEDPANFTELTTVYAASSINSSLIDNATLNTTAQNVATFSDSSRTNAQDTFEIGSTVYARAFGLIAINNVYFQWISPNNTLIKTSADIPVTAEDDADDLLSTNISLMLGNWTIIVFNAQNDAEVGRTIFYLVDAQLPNITLNYPPDNYLTNETTINFNWTVTDNYDDNLTCNLTINGIVNASNISAANGTPVNYSVGGFSDGVYYWNVTCWDDSGNTRTSQTWRFIRDTAAPSVNLNNPIDNYNTSSTTINFNWTATDNIDALLSCNLTIDGTVNASNIPSLSFASANYSVSGFADGDHYWNVTCVDDSGNTNTSQTWKFTVDATPPTVSLVRPVPGYYNDSSDPASVNFTCNATDNIELASISLYITDSQNSSFSLNQTASVSGTSAKASWLLSLPNGNYTWNCIAYDYVSNYDWAENRTVKVNFTAFADNEAPNVTLVRPSPGYYNDSSDPASVNFTCNATDNINLSNISLYITNSQNLSFALNQTTIVSGTSAEASWLLSLPNGNYTWNCLSYDSSGNYDWAENRTVKVNYTAIVYNQSPSIVIVSPAAGANYNQSNTTPIIVNATDPNGIDTILANITWDATSSLVQLTPTTGDLYQHNFTTTYWVGQYNITIIANNTIGLVNSSETTYFNAYDVTPPEITILVPSNGTQYALNQNFTISVNATDPYWDNVDTVYANISWDSTVETITLVEDDDTQIFEGNFTNTSQFGTYNIIVFANDTYSNTNTEDGYFEVAQAVEVVSGLSCTLTETPQVAEYGEKALFQADLSYTDGTPAWSANVTAINITIYFINSTNTTVVETGNMVFLQQGVWYYEFDGAYHESGNYMGVTNIQTNEVPPSYPSCSALFTISGRGIFRIEGITPDMVNYNTTLRMAAEVTLNGEEIDSSKLQNPELWVERLNGTTQYYNLSNGLQVGNGIVYLDGFFNETGIYYLNWSVSYYNRSKMVKEIVVVNDIDNIDVNNTELEGLIRENQRSLGSLLSEMEKAQEFNEEQVFLITDSINSLSRVSDLMNSGKMTEDEARDEVARIQRVLNDRFGDRISGYLTGPGIPEEGELGWMSLLLIALLTGLMVVFLAGRRKMDYQYTSAPRRRYEIMLSKIGNYMEIRRNRKRQEAFAPQKNIPLTRYFEKPATSFGRPSVKEEIKYGGERLRNQIRYNSYRPRTIRRYQMLLNNLAGRIVKKAVKRRNKRYEEQQKTFQKELAPRKAKPQEIFRPRPEAKTRYQVIKEHIKKKLAWRKTKKKLHIHKVVEKGHAHTRMNAKDLFGAIDECHEKETATFLAESKRHEEEKKEPQWVVKKKKSLELPNIADGVSAVTKKIGSMLGKRRKPEAVSEKPRIEKPKAKEPAKEAKAEKQDIPEIKAPETAPEKPSPKEPKWVVKKRRGIELPNIVDGLCAVTGRIGSLVKKSKGEKAKELESPKPELKTQNSKQKAPEPKTPKLKTRRRYQVIAEKIGKKLSKKSKKKIELRVDEEAVNSRIRDLMSGKKEKDTVKKQREKLKSFEEIIKGFGAGKQGKEEKKGKAETCRGKEMLSRLKEVYK